MNILIAQAAGQAGGQGQMSPLGALLPLILIFFVFYFLLILPQQKKQKKHKQMLDKMQEGNKVVTVGGIIGEVTKIKDDIITLKLKDETKVDFMRNAISHVMQPQQQGQQTGQK
jgi:preprotein translocase subunit YajC